MKVCVLRCCGAATTVAPALVGGGRRRQRRVLRRPVAARETRGPSSPVGAPLPQRGTERHPEAELSRRTGRHSGQRDAPTRVLVPSTPRSADERRGP
jgi:hypothetical protein